MPEQRKAFGVEARDSWNKVETGCLFVQCNVHTIESPKFGRMWKQNQNLGVFVRYARVTSTSFITPTLGLTLSPFSDHHRIDTIHLISSWSRKVGWQYIMFS